MHQTAKIYSVLILLTVLSVIASISSSFISVIMILAALKFIGVSFYFMELKKAHAFWKYGLLLFLILFLILILYAHQN